VEKELAAVRAEATRASEKSRLEVQELQQQLGDTRQQVGALEGQLQAARTNAEQLTQATQELHQQLTATAVSAAAAETERDALRVRAEALEKELVALKKTVLKRRKSREGGE
jgi:chromosome segregation ATPase